MKPTPETERRYKLAIYELPYDTNYRANYQVWKTVKILKEHMERFERERDEAREQRDRLAEALEQWQPIETAPKDRSFILSAHPEHGYLITRWLGAREMWDGWAIEPTHWMSLPKLTTP